MPVRTRAPPRAGDMKEPSGAWHSSSARTGSQIMHHRCTRHANQIAMARNHVEDHSRHAHTLAHASSAVSRSADFGAASPSLPLKGKAAGYWGAEDVQPRAAAEGGYRAPWVPSAACRMLTARGSEPRLWLPPDPPLARPSSERRLSPVAATPHLVAAS